MAKSLKQQKHLEKLVKLHTGRNYNVKEKHPLWKGGKPKCIICDTQLTAYSAKYCKKCANLRERNGRWLNGKSKEIYSFDFTRELKELIRKRDNYTCQECHKKWQENIIAFDVHHINYDKQNCSPENLITLCRKCHSITNCNRKYWKNHFTHKIKI